MKVRIQCFLPDESDIGALVGPAKMQQLKMERGEGLFKSYVLLQEGRHTPGMEVGGKIKPVNLTITAAAVATAPAGIASAVFYDDHKPDSADREQVGVLAGHAVTQHNGLATLIVAGHFVGTHADLAEKRDAVSIEVDVEPDGMTSAGEEIVVTRFGQTTGIALLDSTKTPPAVAGAKELASMRFSTGEERKLSVSETINNAPFDEVRSALRQWIKDRRIFPKHLFPPEETFSEDFGDSAYHKYLKDQLEKERESWAQESGVDTLKAELEEKNKRIAQLETTPALVKKIAELTDQRLRNYIQRNIDRFQPDGTPEGLDKWIESQQKEYTEFLEIVGPTSTAKPVANPASDPSDDVNEFVPD